MVIIRFGHDYEPTCMLMDEARRRRAPLPLSRNCDRSPAAAARTQRPPARPPRAQTLSSVAEKIKNFAVIYVVDTTEARAPPLPPQPPVSTAAAHDAHDATAAAAAARSDGRGPPAARQRRARGSAATRGGDARAQCPDFNTMYELYDPCSIMFFFRNKARTLVRLSLRPPLANPRACPRALLVGGRGHAGGRRVRSTLWWTWARATTTS